MTQDDDQILLIETNKDINNDENSENWMLASRIIKTILLSSGSVIMDAGNKVLAMPDFFTDYEIHSPALLLTSRISAIIFAVQMNTLTRGHAVWKWFAPDLNDSESFSGILKEISEGFQKRGITGKIFCALTGTAGLISATIIIGGRTFSGSDSLFRFMGLTNKYALYSIDSYMALSGITAFYAFSVKYFLRNLFYICENFGIPQSISKAARESLNAILRTIGQTMVSAYVITSTCEQIGLIAILGKELADILIFSSCGLSNGLFSVSRAVEIYKQHVSIKPEAEKQKVDLVPEYSTAQTVFMGYNEVAGLLYGLFFFMTVAASLIDAENKFGIPTQPRYMDIINLCLLTLGAVMVEYDFIVGKARQSLQSMFSNPQTFFYPKSDKKVIEINDASPIHRDDSLILDKNPSHVEKSCQLF